MKSYTAAEVAELDRYTIEDLGVDLKQLMEIAGMRSAEVALRVFFERAQTQDFSTRACPEQCPLRHRSAQAPGRVEGLEENKAGRVEKQQRGITVLAGPGGNGGDALVCAKWLKLWGYDVSVLLSHPLDRLKAVTLHQLEVWKKFGGAVLDEPPSDVEGIVDGLLGYSLEGDPRGRAAELIKWIESVSGYETAGRRPALRDENNFHTQSASSRRGLIPILALDCPSGLDVTTGEARNPCVHAHHTVMYGVAKTGVIAACAQEYVGSWEVVDIGFPREFPSFG